MICEQGGKFNAYRKGRWVYFFRSYKLARKQLVQFSSLTLNEYISFSFLYINNLFNFVQIFHVKNQSNLLEANLPQFLRPEVSVTWYRTSLLLLSRCVSNSPRRGNTVDKFSDSLQWMSIAGEPLEDRSSNSFKPTDDNPTK
jgi:hypothetical protein